MGKDIYTKLREFMDSMPGGFPTTDSGVEMKILKKLFTPEQARTAVELKMSPEPVSEIAQRLRMDERKTLEMLEHMARRGLIYRVRTKSRLIFIPISFLLGIYELHLNTMDRELAEMVEEYLPHIFKSWKSVKTKQLRVIPINESVKEVPAVASYDQIRELVKGKNLIAVAPCICRKEQAIMGNPCDRSLEVCIQFDLSAAYYIENKLGREINEDELMHILKKAEEEALVLSPTNAMEISSICMCCGCCCGVLRMLKVMERPAEHAQSSFQAAIDSELCTACGTCEERCQMDAVKKGIESHTVDRDRCIGCGLCVSTCPEDAIRLVEKPGFIGLPANIVDMNRRILKERGLD
jgi:electron transport complex protein RnfB